MVVTMWLRGLLRHRRARLVGSSAGVAIAVALLATIGAFLSSSKATMTARARASVSTDWQIEVQPGADPSAVGATVRKFAALRNVTEVRFGHTTGFELTKAGSTQTTGPGVVLALPDSYARTFSGSIRRLVGADHGVLLAQQTAANLHAAPGDRITIGREGHTPMTVTVDGIIDLPAADSFFQKVGAPPQAQPSAPPDNVLILPPSQWHVAFDALANARPDLVTVQFHADVAPTLPADPAAAYAAVLARAQNLELTLGGTGLVGNSLGAELAHARTDSLYAQVLFLFLGVPGSVLAGLLTATVAASGADRRRRDQALLRARGATMRRLVSIGLVEAVAVTVVGATVGLLLVAWIGASAFGSATFGAGPASLAISSAAAVVTGAAIAGWSIAWPARRDARVLTVAAARQSVARPRDPRWLRWHLDLVALALAAVVHWATSRNGFRLVLAVEGIPSISVNYWAFLGPALAWIGGGLLVWRIANASLAHGRRWLTTLVRPLSGGLAGTVASSMNRQRRLLARAVVLVAASVAFAVSTSVFNATYQHQAEVDAVLSIGAMVTVTESPGAVVDPSKAAELGRIPGVRSVTAMQHRFAYVGADLQDLYGVDPTTIVRSTKLQDAYFTGGTARSLMAKLAAQPDAVLLSDETVKDFQLAQGDRVRLRLQDGRTKQYVTIPFTYVGIAREFPSAPSDSFIVANAAYVAKATSSNAVGMFLLDTASRDAAAVAGRVRKAVGTSAAVSDIASERQKIDSSLTAVELRGLTRVELGFALVLAAAASGLVLWLGLIERRRTFALAAALGATPRQLGGFVWAEAAFVTIGGMALGAIGGWRLTRMIVTTLSGVFDPPPSSLSVPSGYLVLVACLMLAAVVTAALIAVRSTRRPATSLLRDQ